MAKHNVAFLASYHATKLFRKIFLTLEIVKHICCSRTETTAMVKEALAPHFLKKATDSMSYPFSLIMNECNDRSNKSYIIFGRAFDSSLRDVVT